MTDQIREQARIVAQAAGFKAEEWIYEALIERDDSLRKEAAERIAGKEARQSIRVEDGFKALLALAFLKGVVAGIVLIEDAGMKATRH